MISIAGWLCIIVRLLLIAGFEESLGNTTDYKKKKKSDFDYMEYKDEI